MKLKVVIADDEARICKLIQILADWDALGMEVVGVAANGIEALEQVRIHRPHILITDIRMPGCSGLDLIEKAKEDVNDLQIIIISGYAQFEYAQAAMKFGVGDYLLKPIKKEELMSTLAKLGQHCREKMTEVQEVNLLKQVALEDGTRLRNSFLHDLETGKMMQPSAECVKQHYHVALENGMILPFYLKMDYTPELFSQSSLDMIQTKVDGLLHSALSPLCHELVLRSDGAWVSGLLNYAPKKRDAIRRTLRDCLNQLTAQRNIFGDMEFSISLGQESKDFSDLVQSQKWARNLMAERLVEGTGRLIERTTPPRPPREERLLEGYAQMLDHAEESGSIQEAARGVTMLWEQAGQLDELTGAELLHLVTGAASLFAIRMNIPNRDEQLAQLDLQLQQCSRIAKLFQCLQNFQTAQMAYMQAQQSDIATRPIRLAKQYVQNHLGENISLETVSASIGLSSSYFSAAFKKETGEGFVKYITRVRIDRAKELLQQTELPVSEICQQVGYSDLKHFTATFKKITNLSPGQYRKIYG